MLQDASLVLLPLEYHVHMVDSFMRASGDSKTTAALRGTENMNTREHSRAKTEPFNHLPHRVKGNVNEFYKNQI